MPTLKVEKKRWLKIGIQRFSILGKQGINVEQMAKKLNCNKSSFYHHFSSKENFLNEMIQYWFDQSMLPITTGVEEIGNPKSRFERFLIMGFEDKSRKDLMFHFRKEAKKNAKLDLLLNQLMKKRLNYGSKLIQDLGYSENEAKQKAEIAYHFYLGWYELNKDNVSKNKQDVKYAINLIKTFIDF